MKLMSFILCVCLTMSVISGCNTTRNNGSGDSSANTKTVLPYTKSEQIKLTELSYSPRRDFERSRITLNSAFPAGYVSKRSLFVHPTSTKDYTFADYDIDLTGYKNGSLIILEYNVGIADGANADGVDFASFINDKKVMSVVSKENRWINQTADISTYAGKKFKLSLGTKGSPTVNSAWAAFGDPVINAIEDNTNYLAVGDGKEINTVITGDLVKKGESYAGTGKLQIDSSDFTNGDAYVIISGKGDPAIKTSVGNRAYAGKQLAAESKGEYREMITISNTATRRSDWNVALGLPISAITPVPFDRVLPYPRVLSVELAGDKEYTVDSIEVWRKPGTVKVSSFKTGAYIEHTNMDTAVNVKFSNSGAGAILKTDGYELYIEYSDSKSSKKTTPSAPIPDMAMGSEYTFSFSAGKLKPGECIFNLILKDARGANKIAEYRTIVKDIDNNFDSDKNGNLSIQDDKIKLVLIKEGDYYKEASLFEKSTKTKAGAFAIPRLVAESKTLSIGDFKLNQKTGSGITLYQQTELGEVLISYEITGGSLKIIHKLTASKDFGLLAFDGPQFLCGEGSFGGAHDSAIFAGIDYLSTEDSNNTLAGAKPESNRFAPNPKKITTPLMTIAKNGLLASFSWPSLKEWMTGYNMPMARFESPSLDASDYSIMGLFAPSGTQYLKENTLLAHNPMPVKATDIITLEADIKISRTSLAVDGFVDYIKTKGLPEPSALNKTQLDVFKALVKGHEAELINENGWLGFLGVDSVPSINSESVHTLIAAQHLLSDGESKTASDIISKIKIPSSTFEWSYSDSVYFRLDKDYMDGYYTNAENISRSILANQKEDGTWGYNAGTPKAQQFGRQGDVTMGTVAIPVIQLVKAAKLTGSKESWDGALLGIEALSKFTKPAGAGPWELPNTNPDILAAFLGLKACIDAYEYSGDVKILQKAVQIAKQSLPFIYFSEVPRKPVSLYTTVPSFGATNWTRMWQGSPVLWEGVLLAEELKRIDRYDKTLDWGKIGAGITNASINLVNNDRQPGRFPDYLDLFKSDSTIYNIWGNLTARTVYSDLGFMPEWSEKRISGVRVVSGYEISNLEIKEKIITTYIKIPSGMPCYLLLHTGKVLRANVNGIDMPMLSDNLDNVTNAYRKMVGKDIYVFKIKGNKDASVLKIQVE